MNYQWSDDLATGVAEIDSQHKELLKRFNALITACNQQKGREEVGRFIMFLMEYVIEHFNDEEQLMIAKGYTGLQEHKAEHVDFTKKVISIKREFLEDGAGIHVVLKAVRLAGEWFVNHIKTTDKKMAAALRTVA